MQIVKILIVYCSRKEMRRRKLEIGEEMGIPFFKAAYLIFVQLYLFSTLFFTQLPASYVS